MVNKENKLAFRRVLELSKCLLEVLFSISIVFVIEIVAVDNITVVSELNGSSVSGSISGSSSSLDVTLVSVGGTSVESVKHTKNAKHISKLAFIFE